MKCGKARLTDALDGIRQGILTAGEVACPLIDAVMLAGLQVAQVLRCDLDALVQSPDTGVRRQI
jgi:hypothetical protein